MGDAIRSMQLAHHSLLDVGAVDTDLALLPVGSTEQHGPHAPLGVDFLTAEAIADTGSEAYSDEHEREVVVAPTIPVGIAAEHRDFAGTLWVEPDTFRSYVGETIESLFHHGFERVVVVNGHGGNANALRECCGRLSRDRDSYAVAYTWFDAVDSMELGHGGPAETSLIRHLHPGLIDEARTDEAAAGAADGWGEWVSGSNLAYDSSEFTDSGVVGDPREGDAALGEQLLEEAVEALVDLLEAVASRER